MKPGDQRSAGYFDTVEKAADEILSYLCTGVPPPTPKKDRKKRGEGRQPPAKRQRAAQQASPATPFSELPSEMPTPDTFAAMGVYTAPCFEGAAPGAPTVAASLLSHM